MGNFGIREMDNYSARRVVNSIAAVVPRNYVIMEVKSNLIEGERKEVLKRFSASHFKKVAHVVMGEPSEEFKKTELEKMLVEKQENADNLWKAKKVEKERKKQAEEQKKESEEKKGGEEKKEDEEEKKG